MKFIFFIIPLIVAISPILDIYGQEKADLVLELEGLVDTKIKQFTINNTTIWNEICPFNQCKIKYTFTFLSQPVPKFNDFSAGYSVDFDVIDNVTHAGVTPVKKKFLERFGIALSKCNARNVDDIVEKNNTVIYNCSRDSTWIYRAVDNTYWSFDVKGRYDSAKENLKLTGNLKECSNRGLAC